MAVTQNLGWKPGYKECVMAAAKQLECVESGNMFANKLITIK